MTVPCFKIEFSTTNGGGALSWSGGQTQSNVKTLEAFIRVHVTKAKSNTSPPLEISTCEKSNMTKPMHSMEFWLFSGFFPPRWKVFVLSTYPKQRSSLMWYFSMVLLEKYLEKLSPKLIEALDIGYKTGWWNSCLVYRASLDFDAMLETWVWLPFVILT